MCIAYIFFFFWTMLIFIYCNSFSYFSLLFSPFTFHAGFTLSRVSFPCMLNMSLVLSFEIFDASIFYEEPSLEDDTFLAFFYFALLSVNISSIFNPNWQKTWTLMNKSLIIIMLVSGHVPALNRGKKEKSIFLDDIRNFRTRPHV